MSPNLRFRTACTSDAMELEELESRAWDSTNSPNPTYSGPVFGKRIPFEDVIVACLEGRVIGYAALGKRTPFESNQHIGVLRALVVVDSFRGQGIGAQLLTHAEQHAATRGIEALRRTVMSTNEAALRLYARAGWSELGRYPGEFRFEARSADDVLLGKQLAQGARNI